MALQGPPGRAALTESAQLHIQIYDTGDIDRDARTLARSVAGALSQQTSGAVVRATVSAAQTEERHQIARQFWASRLLAVRPMIDRALAVGRLPHGTDAAQVIDAIAAPLYFRLLVSAKPITQHDADRPRLLP